MNKCTSPDPCFFKERGLCSRDFGSPCPDEEERPEICPDSTTFKHDWKLVSWNHWRVEGIVECFECSNCGAPWRSSTGLRERAKWRKQNEKRSKRYRKWRDKTPTGFLRVQRMEEATNE